VHCFKELNGMFALAIYDVQKNIFTLARDHAGIKPLFIYYDDNEFIFASELKVIQSLKSRQLNINKKAIAYFLHLGFIPHPFTIYNKTEKFPAAHYLQLNANAKNFNHASSLLIPFWQPEFRIGKKLIKDEKTAKEILKDLLFDSVKKQLISDVPIGTFLSGGIDSSLVTAIACQVSDKQINSYSITIDDGKFNESKYAKQVADHLQTNHHEFKVKEREVMELIDDFIPMYDEPFADSSAFPTMMVSRLAKKDVTVALSGDGGDELFMGYGSYNWAKTLNKKWVSPLRYPLYSFSQLMSDRYKRAGNLFAFDNKAHLKSHIFSQEQYFFSESELASFLTENNFDFENENRNFHLYNEIFLSGYIKYK